MSGRAAPLAAPTAGELRRLIRASAVFDAAQKRAWIDVLPHLAPAHRVELWEILMLEHAPLPPAASDAGTRGRGDAERALSPLPVPLWEPKRPKEPHPGAGPGADPSLRSG